MLFNQADKIPLYNPPIPRSIDQDKLYRLCFSVKLMTRFCHSPGLQHSFVVPCPFLLVLSQPNPVGQFSVLGQKILEDRHISIYSCHASFEAYFWSGEEVIVTSTWTSWLFITARDPPLAVQFIWLASQLSLLVDRKKQEVPNSNQPVAHCMHSQPKRGEGGGNRECSKRRKSGSDKVITVLHSEHNI